MFSVHRHADGSAALLAPVPKVALFFLSAGLDSLAAKVADIAGRDENDKSRLLSLYGVNYQDRSAFDVVIDTNGKSPDQVKHEILTAVRAKTRT